MQACETFVQSGHFDADNIKSKADLVLERYTQLSVRSSNSIARMIVFNLGQVFSSHQRVAVSAPRCFTLMDKIKNNLLYV